MPVQSRLLSIVIPAYNEAGRLPATLKAVRRHLEHGKCDAEIIVVDDGSSDDTCAAARSACPDWGALRCIRLERNLGKGAAVRRGVREARGEVIAFIDADLPYDLSAFHAALAHIERGADMVIGGRDLPDSRVEAAYSRLRRLSGWIYSLFVNALAVKRIPDTQCGFKVFRAEAAKALFPRVTLPGFAFDVELLTLAQRWNLRIERIPVVLAGSDGSRVRLVRDSLRMFRDLVKVNRRRARGVYDRCEAKAVPQPCPGCGEDSPQFERGLRGWLVARCDGCALLYLWNRLPESALAEFYDESYYGSGGMAGGYENYQAQGPDAIATARERLAILKRLQPEGRLLEVGCGHGFFLEAAARAYPLPVGIDLSDAAIARARAAGHDAHACTLEQLPDSAGQFDVIYAADLFEHLYRPREFLAAAARRLNPGGVLALVTPDESGWLRLISGGRWVSFKFPEHVAFYTPARLDAWMREAGFCRVHCAGISQRVAAKFLLERLRGLSPAAHRLGAVMLWPWVARGGSLSAPTGNLLHISRKN